ncbi:hypothetical protein AC578_3650 [Pseudocercospora eumusae]|uniref:Uncharacterized protein n=1 Tax=Pseudocercospora eumusae TaxID=321146 RepID=A0A139GV63_9PEZI|nr:hypothetical protein AC578_3650 [Pseudocercospora eumusae]
MVEIISCSDEQRGPAEVNAWVRWNATASSGDVRQEEDIPGVDGREKEKERETLQDKKRSAGTKKLFHYMPSPRDHHQQAQMNRVLVLGHNADLSGIVVLKGSAN